MGGPNVGTSLDRVTATLQNGCTEIQSKSNRKKTAAILYTEERGKTESEHAHWQLEWEGGITKGNQFGDGYSLADGESEELL